MKGQEPQITVVGSFMMDLVIKAERRPQRGETVIGQSFGMYPGGKGFNQAVAARRLGSKVRMIGKLGSDAFGERFLRAMAENGIDSTHVLFDENAHSGVGSPVIDAQGDNSIIIVPGANMNLTPSDVENARGAISAADLLMCQLENPLETVLRAAEIAVEAGVPVMLNPAPAQPLPQELLKHVSVLTPNEIEAEMLTGLSVKDDASAAKAARMLQASGVRVVVVTLGGRGALAVGEGEIFRVAGYQVDVIDTTAAGDAFCAALALQLAQKRPLVEAVRFANSAGALACTVLGAEPAMPWMARVEEFMRVNPSPQVIPVSGS